MLFTFQGVENLSFSCLSVGKKNSTENISICSQSVISLVDLSSRKSFITTFCQMTSVIDKMLSAYKMSPIQDWC